MKRVACLVALLLVCGAVSVSADIVIHRGIDAFTTTNDGSTRSTFSDNPIPAGFFCKGSAPFAGDIPLKGLPLVTAEKGQLHGADTLVERLDDVTFDRNGLGVTRVKMAALSFVSIEPLQTSCGAFHVYVSLNGAQRTTTMHVFLEHEHGGSFVAPLAVDAKIRFVPVDGHATSPLELTGKFNFNAERKLWALPSGRWPGEIGEVVVDTDGDGRPDRAFAGTANFAAGYPSAWAPPGTADIGRGYSCYTDPYTGERHCTWTCSPNLNCQIP